MAKIQINEDNIKQIVDETIRRILNESNEDLWDSLIDAVGYNYYDDDPASFVRDFEYMVRDVLTESEWGTDYHCTPEELVPYLTILRERVNGDYQKMYEGIKAKQIEANQVLDNCVEMITKYKQGYKL
jgi:hypothetical protein